MASLFKYVNHARDTICKNCTSFVSNYPPFNEDWCIYDDRPVNKDNNLTCSEYREPGDDEENIPEDLLKKGKKLYKQYHKLD